MGLHWSEGSGFEQHRRRWASPAKLSVATVLGAAVLLTSVTAWAITWNTKRSMPTARSHLATASTGGKVYVLGGTPTAAATLNSAYDPRTITWATKAPMPTPREDLAAVSVGSKIYAIGGYNPLTGFAVATVQAYNPSTNRWATRAPMHTARAGLAAAVGSDGKIYAIGGWNTKNGFNDNIALATVEAYNPATNSWTTKRSMPTARYFLAAAAVGGKIYAFDGVDTSTNTVTAAEVYAPATNIWKAVAPLPGGGLEGLAAASLGNKVYVIGGADVDFQAYNQVQAYTSQASMPIKRGFLAATAIGLRVYTIGGASSGSNGAPLATVERF
jgi:N-acetylneuraminic acid mutarotase